jgi:Mn2+/Fe2+ NRAMP family transporter
METIKFANLTLRFLLELCMLAALGYWGLSTGEQLVIKIGLGIGVPLLAGVVWGIFLAPKSARRLDEPLRLILELAIFGLAITALYIAGPRLLAWVFGLMYVVNKILLTVWRQ